MIVVLSGVLCGALLFGSNVQKAEAQSGWQVLRVERDGKAITHVDATPNWNNPAAPPTAPAYDPPPTIWPQGGAGSPSSTAIPFPYAMPKGVGAKVEQKGKWRVVYQWQAMLPPYTAPTTPVYFKITVGGNGSSSSYTGSVPGLRDTSKESVEVSAGGAAGVSVPRTNATYKAASKTYLVQARPSGNQLTTPWIEGSATATVSGNRVQVMTMLGGYTSISPLDGHVDASVSGSVAFDDKNRRVTLARAGSPAPKADGSPTLNKYTDEWIESDGTGHGHTRWSFDEYSISSPTGNNPTTRTNWQNISALLGGTWSSSPQWTWSPQGGSWPLTPDTKSTSSQPMPKGTAKLYPSGWSGISGIAQHTISYSITDSDGAIANAQYILTLHDEYETKGPDNVAVAITNVRDHPYAMIARQTSAGQSLEVSVSDSHTWEVGASAEGEAGKFMAGNLGISLSGSISCTSEAGVTCVASDVPVGFGTWAEIFDVVKVHTGTVYKWSDAGYVGEPTYKVTEPNSVAWGVQAHVPYRDLRGTP